MNYLQLKKWIDTLVDSIDEFRDELSDDYAIVDEYSDCRAILPPETIKENLINDLQEIMDKCRENDA